MMYTTFTECIAVFNNIYKETKEIPTKQIATISMLIFEMLLVGMRGRLGRVVAIVKSS